MNESTFAEATKILYKGRAVKGLQLNPEVVPYFPATAFTMKSLTEVKEAYESGYTYVRTNSPNRDALAEILTYLEQGEKSLVFSSGMAAITTTLLTLLKPEDHLIVNRNVYGETFSVATNILSKFGIKVQLVNFDTLDLVRQAVTPNTKMVYTEVLANPTLGVTDIPALSDIARRAGAWLMIDNTFTTPIGIKPITMGADIVMNSLTKFLNGCSDVLGGSITSTEEIINILHPSQLLHGTSGDPYASFTMLKNITTADLRIRRQMANAAKLAAALEKTPHVGKVYHPSLKSFPQHALAMKLFASEEAMTGMLSIVVPEDESKIDAFLSKLRLAHYAPTLGGVHTTLAHPVTSSHRTMPDADRRAMGVTPGLIRISCGIEDPEDLIADFTQALSVFD